MSSQAKVLAEWLREVDIEPKGSLLVYETEEPKAEAQVLYELAERFGIVGEIERKEDVNLISQEKRVLAMYPNSGAFWYADFAKLGHPEYKPELPSDEEATDIALDYLKRNNWLPEDMILDGVHRNEFERVEGEKDGKKTRHPNHICVDFRASLNQLNTYGPGAKVKVFIGHEGEVIGVLRAARTLREYEEFPLLSRADLEEVLQSKLGVPLEKIELMDAKLAYHAESFVLNSRFVQPVYVFELATLVESKRQEEPTMVAFETHPLPATPFAPIVTIKSQRSPIEIRQDQVLTLSCDIRGGSRPFKVSWDSNVDGHLSDEQVLETKKLSVAHREGRVTSHTITVTVTDERGMQDSHQVLVKVYPAEGADIGVQQAAMPDDPNDPYVGVEWCNLYHGTPGLPDISGTRESARGFKDYIQGLPNWSSRFDWGNDAAWEQDFKFTDAPGGGTDSYWADNVDFAFFAGHGGPGSFFFGSTVDDHEMRAEDAKWGDKRVNWVVLHACETMRANFGWTVWCDAFTGLHQMFGFHTVTEGSTPPLGTRFAYWMAEGHDMRTAWRTACAECFDALTEYAMIYVGQTGTDTHNDHLPGYGHVSPDPTSPYYWVYSRGTC
jgi:hypothetical protein